MRKSQTNKAIKKSKVKKDHFLGALARFQTAKKNVTDSHSRLDAFTSHALTA
jgi:hypothetical protein